jgi:mutator protein MutT
MKPGIDYIGISVGALITNSDGKLFLTKRGNHVTNEAGTWEIPGGKVGFGESLTDAIKREMTEEYGVSLRLTYQFPAQNHLIPAEHQHWVPTCFLAEIERGEPTILEPEKCDAIGWFALDRLPEPLSIITKLDIATYRRYLAGDDLFSL